MAIDAQYAGELEIGVAVVVVGQLAELGHEVGEPQRELHAVRVETDGENIRVSRPEVIFDDMVNFGLFRSDFDVWDSERFLVVEPVQDDRPTPTCHRAWWMVQVAIDFQSQAVEF